MKKWSREEKLLKSYFKEQVKAEASASEDRESTWRPLLEQCALMAMGALCFMGVSSIEQPADHYLSKGIELVSELFSTLWI